MPPCQPIEMVVNPTLPDAYCKEDPYALVLGIEDDIRAPFDPTRPFNLRIAFKAQSDGRIWVAVEDDADWPTACHVSALGDWVYTLTPAGTTRQRSPWAPNEASALRLSGALPNP